ncbi:hypothetical protein [Leptothoe sp. PORK10 BA2]|uniref:hypothetical protein n=1 Tax=Leptothoe sp. PORK10 BA2 TaxID=3110254 RepID=UPI002B204626|nr:hypothetical protein [Leptothoe sp. PORK10 BA2]MEA5466513.1 hypothetical protein [Leptothoe sp. PORK10 BA2]
MLDFLPKIKKILTIFGSPAPISAAAIVLGFESSVGCSRIADLGASLAITFF